MTSGTAAPVIALTYAYGGARQLRSLLAADAALVLTSGTGIIPVCNQAVAFWRRIEPGRPALSALAAASVRGLVIAAATSLSARSGRPRWCEVTMASTDAVGVFGDLFPDAQFICLHRACADAVDTALAAPEGDLALERLRPFATSYPGNRVAAETAYWCAHTESLLEFEASHPGRCCRVRHEDLLGSPGTTSAAMSAFLGLALPPDGRRAVAEGAEPPDGGPDARPDAGQAGRFDARRLPAPLAARAGQVLSALGYPGSHPADT